MCIRDRFTRDEILLALSTTNPEETRLLEIYIVSLSHLTTRLKNLFRFDPNEIALMPIIFILSVSRVPKNRSRDISDTESYSRSLSDEGAPTRARAQYECEESSEELAEEGRQSEDLDEEEERITPLRIHSKPPPVHIGISFPVFWTGAGEEHLLINSIRSLNDRSKRSKAQLPPSFQAFIQRADSRSRQQRLPECIVIDE
eukprot:TRINITY_DN15682_c0_g1_i1.p1 TRINITY_DN15682_c0_g1~~TRINITY_DN15682_c0_g1_i1.p1  ORF type:complete len:220 (-),score=45.01 TRINITY_DN15682_c0_g1_i1:92-694(-)